MTLIAMTSTGPAYRTPPLFSFFFFTPPSYLWCNRGSRVHRVWAAARKEPMCIGSLPSSAVPGCSDSSQRTHMTQTYPHTCTYTHAHTCKEDYTHRLYPLDWLWKRTYGLMLHVHFICVKANVWFLFQLLFLCYFVCYEPPSFYVKYIENSSWDFTCTSAWTSIFT